MNILKIDFDHWKGAEIGDSLMAAAQEAREQQLVANLKPDFSLDGNMYCFLYGTLPNDCIVGYGETPAKAMANFYNNFMTEKAAPIKSLNNK